ncbi:receptor-like protein EIX1 [Ziziphus jujuba]|uniref:Receptor-like protein EIX1 n=1 Tax=Ziziphus jujuba TaxID=326968 RepID=A0ABM4AGY5_ZIZJJ|nr:receptor-like protein EIX1 [Ziziphus jujuba]
MENSNSVVMVFLIIFATSSAISFCNGNLDMLCNENERQALLTFKQDLKDPMNQLSNWDESGDCCNWTGIVCNKTTGHVLELHLANNLGGKINPSLLNLTYLNYLDLTMNDFGGIQIPSFIGSLKSLINLDLSNSGFTGIIPHQLGNLCMLKQLDLSDNNYALVSEVLANLSGCTVNSLEILELDRNQLSGQLPDELLGQFRNLVVLSLTSNSISDPIPESLGKLSHLQMFDVFSNRLNGSLPESIGQLAELQIFYISFNLLEGEVSDIHFANITSLEDLYASGNSLTLKTSPAWLPPFQLHSLHLNSWNLGPELPQWIQRQTVLSDLRVSNTSISGRLPTWFKNFSAQLDFLNISCNQLYGEFPVMISLPYSVFDLSSNQFSGSLPPIPSTNVGILDLSNNLFSGSITDFMCYLNGGPNMLRKSDNSSILSLGNNLLSGEIPNCLMNWNNLMVLHLENNNFVGRIPSSMGYLSNLRSLHLRNNNLSGELPSSLQNCKLLLNVDLSANKFGGRLPQWFGASFSNLSVLNLGSNNFHGDIPPELCNLKYLRILVLSHNQLSGEIPRCFGNFTAMAILQNSSDPTSIMISTGDWQFLENALLTSKGRQFEYSTLLKLVVNLDLSDNNLLGKIPEELTRLVRLQSLNLSMNRLIGQIPSKIGDMGLLESLDLSRNQLSGQLPPSIASLSFLSHLNLSYNNLSGRIPTSTQLQSLDGSSFIVNQLCGPPLAQNCSESDRMPPGVEEEEEDREGNLLEQSGFHLSLGLGFAIGFWTVLGSLLFNTPWSIVCHRLLDIAVLKLYSIIVEYF